MAGKTLSMTLGLKIAAGALAAVLLVGGGAIALKVSGDKKEAQLAAEQQQARQEEERKQEQQKAAEPKPTATPMPEQTPPPALNVNEKYKPFVAANYPECGTVLADLTHDGTPELLVTTESAEDMQGTLSVFTLDANGAVKRLEENFATGYHAGEANYYLYRRDEKDYLYYYVLYLNQGYVNFRLEIYALDENGQHIILEQDECSGELQDQDPAQNAFVERVNRYAAEGMPLLYTDMSGSFQNGVYTHKGNALTDLLVEVYRKDLSVPDKRIYRVALPLMREDLPHAEKINSVIRADFDTYWNLKTPADCDAIDLAGYRIITYNEFEFDGLYEIYIELRDGELNAGFWIHSFRYYYDSKLGDTITEAEFLRRMGYTEEDIVEICRKEFRETYGDTEGDLKITYEDIRDGYYVDADGKLQFTYSPFG